ncbi:RNA polymerase sigma factor [Streptomyces sp. NPDC059837]|uniref:RNA polymerase sigma factor n=1 Tax=Streptomyces sp. NPDC059837 TaxID=3346968 RepID=UPI003648D283
MRRRRARAVEEMLDAQPRLRRLLMYKFGFSEHNAEDVLSGVRERWMRPLRERSTAPESPRSYLSALTRNAAVDHLRKAGTRHEVLIDGTDWSVLEPQPGYERSPEDVVADSAVHEELLAKHSLPLHAAEPSARAEDAARHVRSCGPGDRGQALGRGFVIDNLRTIISCSTPGIVPVTAHVSFGTRKELDGLKPFFKEQRAWAREQPMASVRLPAELVHIVYAACRHTSKEARDLLVSRLPNRNRNREAVPARRGRGETRI